MPSSPRVKTVLVVFGTRPELIKLAPVIQELVGSSLVRPVVVSSGQHTDLLPPLLQLFDLRVDHDLRLMTAAQTPTQFCARLLAALDPVLAAERPTAVVVQGDTTTALGAALAAFYQRIPVGHVEAGLRSGDAHNPFPEEMNRRLISRLATLHFAPTGRNRDTLLGEGVRPEHIVVTGNPIIDALHTVLERHALSPEVRGILAATAGYKRLLLTTHRRESFGAVLAGNLGALRDFVAAHDDVALLFPVHPNPEVRGPATEILGRQPRVHLLPPLNYGDFIGLLARAWLIVSDSGGVQEEAPSLDVPLLLLRKNTERPEAVECGCARLVGDDPRRLRSLVEEMYQGGAGPGQWRGRANPFGHGDSAKRIVAALMVFLGISVLARGQ
jgi:UDP-N-acetylglucosamine 2-epimerase (non-hydrolysing)